MPLRRVHRSPLMSPRACAFQGEARMHRTFLSPFHGFDKVLVRLGAWSLWILATPPRQPLAHRGQSHIRFTTGRS